MRQLVLWREKGCVLSYVPDASLFLLRRAIASRGKPVLSCWRCRAMFNSCLTSRDWSRRQYNDSAPSIYSSTMQEAFRGHLASSTSVNCTHRILEGKLLNYIRVTREVVPYMQ